MGIDHAAFLRSRIPRRPLSSLVAQLVPGGRVVAARRLKGGIDSAVHRVEIEAPAGRTAVVVRRFDTAPAWYDPARLAREHEVLEALAPTPVPAPVPLLADPEGEHLGVPTLVLSCLPGRSILPVGDRRWALDLAGGLALVHDQGSRIAPEPWLLDWQQEVMPDSYRGHPDAARIWAALGPWRAALVEQPQCLCHHDFHPGNTVWRRGRLTGIVDWSGGAQGWPGFDLAYCRLDTFLQLGPVPAGAVAAAYQAVRGGVPAHGPAWDLVAALRALPDPEPWLACYLDLGVPLDQAGLWARLRAFIDAALDALPPAP